MSNKFQEYKELNLNKFADEILEFWKKNNIFQESIKSREGNPQFVFFEGPPSANGMPGIHHVMARTIKDIFCRYQTLKGKQVNRKAGWDTHGLPVELGVEKELGITKEDIGKKITVEEYNKACKEAVMRYTGAWNELTQKIGYWVDLNHPYITYDPKYMESVWWLLKQIYDKNLLYKGYTIQPYSPKAGTGLSSHELSLPGAYKDITDTTIVAQFKAIKESTTLFNDIQGDVYFLAWTTTPWTLPSNTALTVGGSIDYVLVKTFNQYTFEPINVILAKELVGSQFSGKFVPAESDADFQEYTSENKKIPYRILAEYKGKDLVGIKYEQLLSWTLPYEDADRAFVVIDGDHVTTEDGTGIVHTAPTFGADDAKVAKEHGVPGMLVLDENQNPVPLVDLQGKFISSLPEPFAGKYVRIEYYNDNEAPERSTDVEIAILLKTENKAFKVEKYNHNYPHCWRTDKPILYYPLDSWFIKITEVRDRMTELNQSINWKPKSTGEGRFGNWLENANDWNLSRSRYWGTPLPIWRTEDAKEEIIIGSIQELIDEMEKSIKAGFMSKNIFEDFIVGDFSEENYSKIDLHKNIVDQIVLVSESGKPMKRESDLIDVWFDSGAMPYAQWHYPFENKELIDERKYYPADFIAEGVDQTRGWFYTLHAIGTMIFDSVTYKNVVSNGLVLDKKGNKMSKSKGNAVEPFETLAMYGPDATRWYMISNAQPWDNLKFDLEGIDEVRRKIFGTLYNTYSFFALYANVDGFSYKEDDIHFKERNELDQWILSELNLLIDEVDSFYTDYEPTKALRAINTFVIDNLSNWYVRLSRRRFWKGEYSNDKISAYQTLYKCLDTIAKLMSPAAPFYSDKLYQDLNAVTGKEPYASVHLAYFPVKQENEIDYLLLERTHLAQKVTTMVFSLRKKENIKVRQPLQKIMIPVLSKNDRENLESIIPIIKQEVNVKEVQLLNPEEASDIIVKAVKPNFKTLGPKLGKDLKAVSQELQQLSSFQIEELEKNGAITLSGYELNLDDVEIRTQDITGWLVANDGKLTVALDITITPELKSEGIARELVNKIQNLRKENGLEVTDKISLEIQANEEIEKSVNENMEYICSETLTQKLTFVSNTTDGTELDINEIKIKIVLKKV
ncbi:MULTISPECIES: isoleucine--tRNA ligase [unclassified Apibacter]|uniref:isoleucine--tRNA ligase n=1 Tax=unclassified Apibacter TaxID=2630820 RepID=UPI001323477D|nr:MULTISPECIES: isoleucine--tRNA ligase [unclassified Apibacter]MCX8677523.1 isoleucine--tRNA ligase [Apibacter sp. B3919]MXO24273.1 isoleucine--tRNA ligase [Apibacter sp. B3924]MXO27062.1 isoleucine--tRNA ligase [Apibacter sp. B3813]MXO28811.1 isoleucine--tRNA ligase [Apibacter sp. B3913]MXO30762.1 isoleucine--tRNA ligase [Apibacter sp. B3912]